MNHRLPKRAIISAAILALSFAHSAAGADADHVGDWSDPTRLVIEGSTSFPADIVKAALLANFDVLEAGHRLAPLAEYPAVLAEKLKVGYQHSGFPNVKIDARIDQAKNELVLSVVEGQQFRYGAVQVSGKTLFDPAQLKTWLESQQPPESAVLESSSSAADKSTARWVNSEGQTVSLSPPKWAIGKPAQLDQPGMKTIEENVRRGMAEMGYPWAKFELNTPLDAVHATVPLKINITEPGPPANIGRIRVVGNKRDSEDDVIEFLGVKRGAILTDSERTRLWHKLWLSGRYLQQTVELIAPENSPGEVELRITLVEYDKAPPLTKPLSPVEQTLMKCREWILANDQRGDDWVCRFSGLIDGTVIVSPKHGLLLHVRPRQPNQLDAHGLLGDIAWPEIAVAFTPERLLYANSIAPQKLDLPWNKMRIEFGLGLTPTPDPTESNRFSLMLHAGINHDAKNGASHVKLSLSISPVACLGIAHEYDPKCEFQRDALTIKNSTGPKSLRIDSKSGQLLGLILHSDHLGQHLETTLENGAYEKEFESVDAQLDRRLSKPDNAYDSRHCVSSLAAFLLDDPVLASGTNSWATNKEQATRFDRIRHALRKAVSAGLLDPIDDKLASDAGKPATDDRSADNDDDKFKIPDEYDGLQDWAQQSTALARMCLDITEKYFPRGCWPSAVVRDCIFMGFHRSKYLSASLADLLGASGIGPLGHLALIAPFSSKPIGPNPGVIHIISAHGLSKLYVEDFERDLRPFLDRSKCTGQCVCHVAETLLKLNDDDATAIGSLFLGDHGDLLGDVVRRLRLFPDRPIESALPAVLDQMWVDGLRSLVEERLRTISGIKFQNTDPALDLLHGDSHPPEKAKPVQFVPPPDDYHLGDSLKIK